MEAIGGGYKVSEGTKGRKIRGGSGELKKHELKAIHDAVDKERKKEETKK